jgi:hypothetical protein
MLNSPDPSEAVRKNVELALGISQARQQQQLHNLQAQEIQQRILDQQQVLSQQKMAQQRTMAFNQTVANSPQTPEGLVAAMYQYPDKMKEITDIQNQQGALNNKRDLALWSPIAAASMHGSPAEVQNQIALGIEAATNSKNPEALQKLNGFLQQYNDPSTRGAAIRQLNGHVALAMGPDKYLENLGAANKLPDAMRQAKSEADKANSDALKSGTDAGQEQALNAAKIHQDTEAGNFSAANTAKTKQETDQERQLFGPKLDQAKKESLAWNDNDQKDFRDERSSYLANTALSNKLGSVIKGYDMEKPTPGIVGQIQTQWRTLMGNRTEADAFKNQYEQVTNATTLEQLKGAGRMTQGEIDLIKSGMPPMSAKATEISNFLRKLKKATDEKAALSRENLAWMAANKGGGPAKTDLRYDGLVFPAGSLPPELHRVAPDAIPMTHNAIDSMVQYVNHPGGDPKKKAQYTAELAKRGLTPSG